MKGKIDWMKAGVIALLLADLGLAYPLYAKFNEDPMASLAPPPPATSGAEVQLSGGADEDTRQIVIGLPPAALLAWDPFAAPRGQKPPPGPVVETTTIEPEPMSPTEEIAVDAIRLLGIISLNGQYSALVAGEAGGAEELRRGMIVPGTEDIRCIRITRDGILLAQPGYVNTFLPLSQPSLSAQPWYSGEADTRAIRGRIEIRRR